MTANGGNVTRLARDISRYAWSPDGNQIAYAPYYNSSQKGIFVIEIETGTVRPLTVDGFSPSWSPDGSHLAFFPSDGGLAIVNSNGGSRRFLIEPGFRTEESRRTINTDHLIQWSPDGSRLLFNAGFEIYMVDTNGSDPIPVTKSERSGEILSGNPLPPGSINPVWSPDGTHFAFASSREDHISYQIYIADFDGGNPTRLTDPETVGFADSPAWSPDGTRIAFTASNGVYVIDIGGSNLVKVSDAGEDFLQSKPSWSPDSTQIIFGKDGAIYSVNIDGSQLRKLADFFLWWEGFPTWSP